MYQWSFWKKALERAVKSFIQGVLAIYTVDGVFSLLNSTWEVALSAGGTMAAYSILTSILSAPIGEEKGDPSLVT